MNAKKIKVFTDKYPLIGPTFWIISAQYFIVQLIVALGWPIHYSFSKDAISDLGNTICGMYGPRYVCSPFYSWMNMSFIVLGATMIAGSTLIYQEFRKNNANKLAYYRLFSFRWSSATLFVWEYRIVDIWFFTWIKR
jgi:hypothetical membrane protein